MQDVGADTHREEAHVKLLHSLTVVTGDSDHDGRANEDEDDLPGAACDDSAEGEGDAAVVS